jgi:hypothetical protein
MNLATETMKKLTNMLTNTDSKLAEWGKEPFATRKITPTEDRLRFQNLTQDDLLDMIEKHGYEDVNKWIQKHMEGR